MKRGFTKIELLVAVVILVLVMACLGIEILPFQWIFYLLFGWIIFLWDKAPRMEYAAGPIALGLGSLAGFAAGLHLLLRRMPAWRLRWTLNVTALLVLMFVAGISMVGLSHQIVWSMTSTAPLVAPDGIRSYSQRTQSKNNLKQIALALHNYHDQANSFPPGGTFTADGQGRHSWQTLLLPYLDEQQLSGRIDPRVAWNDPVNAEPMQATVQVYLNPRLGRDANIVGTYGASHYAANGRVIGGSRALAIRDFLDGATNTLFNGEVVSRPRAWGDPTNWRDPALGINASPDGFGGPWTDGSCNFGLADGSVKRLSKNTDPAVLRALSTPDGKETIPQDALDR